ncbi:Serine phosphatase RsbU, regulator of sigma subunit [Amycolatopsis pretoriensis]|uniref:Serine phosphatase RsbU, regulator of sigma subunit n=1 Tax=Amycolatopsis pretoriensis TaxID=218821 RepID=A0A1H5RJ24_9PSEU|nr:SpoIIE family protein phosphatase [Amycolatopsis pretoriensis]SEF38373.1 Serine phosphatase RsbU, regulator of sigma subunit [Amycolatopsis pretoriensis]
MTGPTDRERWGAVLTDAFRGPDGQAVPVITRQLTPEQAATLAGGMPDDVRVFVPDDEVLAGFALGASPTGALAYVDSSGGILAYTEAPIGPGHLAAAAVAELLSATFAGTLAGLRSEAGLLDVLNSVGRQLTAQLDIDHVVQHATDTATEVTGAAFGAFFYNLVDQYGESYTLYTLSGVPRSKFERFPMPRNTAVFGPTFDGAGTVRSADIVQDPRFGKNEPYYGMPEGHLPVHSYLAVSAISPTSGEVLGGFFFGHSEPGRFTERHEYLAEGIAGYAAIALDNARLYERERNLASELSRSMLPVVPDVDGLDIVTRYLPAASGLKIGGDWFDVIPLGSGGTAFVIGDVVGHGVTAATVMGQIRTAIRSYALLELAPSEVLGHVSKLTERMPHAGFATCFYAVHEPAAGTLTYANAGHLPGVLLDTTGRIEQIGEALAQPLGVGRVFPQETAEFPSGSRLLLYTDGLVESRTRDLTVSMGWLVDTLERLVGTEDDEAVVDRLIAELTGGDHDDDIALVHVRHRGEPAVPDLSLHGRADNDHVNTARQQLTAWLESQGLSVERVDDIVLAVYEAMANAVEHAYAGQQPGPLELHGARAADGLTVTVVDYGRWKTPDPTDTIRGRGRGLIEVVSDHNATIQREDGTTVVMTWKPQ